VVVNQPIETSDRHITRIFSRRSRAWFAMAAFVILAAIVAGKSGYALQATPVPGISSPLEVTTTDTSCDITGQMTADEAPFAHMTLKNEGQEPHQVQIVQLQPGKTEADLTADVVRSALTAQPGTDPVVKSFLGGPGAVQTGGVEDVLVELPAAEAESAYVVAICSIPGQEDQGTVKALDNVPSDGNAATPVADVTISLSDTSIDLPTTVNGGRHTWAVKNDGTQPHDLVLVVSAPGMTQENIQLFMQANNGALPLNVAAGGIRILSPGKTGWLQVELPPGQYLALTGLGDVSRAFMVTP
jgi:hypothetical protein